MALDTLTAVTASLAVSFVLSEIFFRFKYPRAIGQIIAGMLLGIPILKVLISPNVIDDIGFLADVGIIFLLLLIGLEINLEKFRKAERDAVIISLFCAIVPFAFGFILMKAIGYSNIVALVVGAAFSLTAEGTTLKVLIDMKALNSKVGIIILGAGIIDDLFEVIFLSVVLVLAHKAISSLAVLPIKLIVFVIVVYLTYKIFPFFLKIVQKERSRIALLSFIIIFGLTVALVSKKLELGPIIGAFIAGIIIHLSEHSKYEHRETIREIESMTFAFIIPFFFINIGLNFDVSSIAQNFWLTAIILLIATLGKLLGALIATPFTDLSLRQTHLIGWGMNSRGAIELVIAEVARINNLIPIEVYSAIVIMAIVTTLLFPVVMKAILSRDRGILKDEPALAKTS